VHAVYFDAVFVVRTAAREAERRQAVPERFEGGRNRALRIPGREPLEASVNKRGETLRLRNRLEPFFPTNSSRDPDALRKAEPDFLEQPPFARAIVVLVASAIRILRYHAKDVRSFGTAVVVQQTSEPECDRKNSVSW
jgi:hypothetical protein